MSLTDDFMYQRMMERDAAYDGRFITGVLTTGIYCLPSCTARKPLRGNVKFFHLEDEAKAAGLRPCKRCRPELFYRGEDWDRSLYEGLTARVAANPARFADAEALAAACGVSAGKLGQLFRDHAHLTPAAWLKRARIRHAAKRLREPGGRIVDIGLEAGFESESAFYRQFGLWMAMAPGAYRALGESGDGRFTLTLPEGYRTGELIAYHGRDAQSLSERVTGSLLQKALLLGGKPALLEIDLAESAGAVPQAHCRLTGSDDLFAAHATALRLLGLTQDPAPFEGRAALAKPFASLIAARPGLRVPLTATIFEALSWAIIGQQINLAFAMALRRSLIAKVGVLHEPSGLYAHPEPAAVAALSVEELTAERYSRSKAQYLIGAAAAVTDGRLPLEALEQGSAQTIEAALTAIRGLGPWTARYTLMRGFGLADAAPIGDSGLSTALQQMHGLEARPDARETELLMAPYSPHRSLATCHLWLSLTKDAG
ncbi:Ada metal-binding domain-containing protein [Radicibacter daui]|uniref:Ada metal-binding domain-containing protein n=1 Tax=Radicibacter daui TaxID=3064829 RepID=UPI004046D645